MAFYDLSKEDRIALTQRAIEEQRTLHERWDALATQEAEPWSARAALAAEFLADEPAVVDLGCGTMTLEHHLTPGTTYYPVDVIQRDDRTLVCDFNVNVPPALPASAAACLGLLEYIFDPAAFMRGLSRYYQTCVVSYCPIDSPQQLDSRRSHAWVSDLSRDAIEQLFQRSGWIIEKATMVSRGQFIWRLRAIDGDLNL